MGRLVDVDEVSKYVIIGNGDLRKVPTVEAIPKADYENHLKADMVAMFSEIQLEIEKERCLYFSDTERINNDMPFISKNNITTLIQEKIDKLKGNEDGNK